VGGSSILHRLWEKTRDWLSNRALTPEDMFPSTVTSEHWPGACHGLWAPSWFADHEADDFRSGEKNSAEARSTASGGVGPKGRLTDVLPHLQKALVKHFSHRWKTLPSAKNGRNNSSKRFYLRPPPPPPPRNADRNEFSDKMVPGRRGKEVAKNLEGNWCPRCSALYETDSKANHSDRIRSFMT